MILVRLVAILVLTSLCLPLSAAQTPQDSIVIDGDVRLFTMVAALNVAGFDVELGSQYHPVRAAIRKLADDLDPGLVRRMREFYATHKNGRPDDEQLARYISLAVVLTDPPDFKPIAREERLPDAAREVLGFAELLREFFPKAGITRLWAAVRPIYEAEMDRMGPAIRDAILYTDAYLRVPVGSSSGQTMRISSELTAPQNSVNVRSHQDAYYVVLGYAASPKIDEVRHAYLHLRLNNLVTGVQSKVAKRDSLTALIAGVDGVSREYVASFESMLTESLIRAVELRIDRLPSAPAEEAIRNHYRTGLLLLPYFYDALPGYEKGDASFQEQLGTMAAGVDVGREQARFQQTFLSIPMPERQPLRAETPVPAAANPVLELLRTAQAAFEKDKERARVAFETVLKDHDPNNGRALYGLALIEMDKENLDEARSYFERTLKSSSADPSMKTWAYIYTGHILDFKCDRAGALENYRKAIETGDNSRDAQKVAQNDLAKPFGGGCPQ